MTIDNNSNLDVSYRKPKTRQRIHKEPPALAVPNINDDAAERKRVLNVLAQRRYRERKRRGKDRGSAKNDALAPRSHQDDDGPVSPMREEALVFETASLEQGSSIPTILSVLPDPGSATTSLESLSDVAAQTRWPLTSFEAPAPNLLLEAEQSCSDTADPNLSTFLTGTSAIGAEAPSFDFLDTMDPRALMSCSSSSPSASGSSETTDVSFPDSYYLPVNELTLLRGLMRIAMRLRCNTTKIWDLGADSPFTDGTHTAQTTQELPLVWRPTLSQSSIPHHPVIDLLPWPSVRDRIILLMGLPDEARPPALAGPLAIAQLAYDLEDGAEGARIWGDDPCEPTSWEVGQTLFERWWFVFDRKVVDQSNYWRALRGAPTLCTKS
ncbi:hypothetical protein F5Y01DRAFT_307586 [Xylaria sp. FL0043]|nr:hypothetical protein F5Y01DRAFT_307586 [Xylaria sp. FL0043]